MKYIFAFSERTCFANGTLFHIFPLRLDSFSLNICVHIFFGDFGHLLGPPSRLGKSQRKTADSSYALLVLVLKYLRTCVSENLSIGVGANRTVHCASQPLQGRRVPVAEEDGYREFVISSLFSLCFCLV